MRPAVRIVTLVILALISHGCASRTLRPSAQAPSSSPRALRPFGSPADLQRAIDRVAASKRDADEARRIAAKAAEDAWLAKCRGLERVDVVVVCGRAPEIDTTTISRTWLMEAALTNQHAGIEEGVNVKRYGDVLIVLRRGRLFTFAIGGGRLDPRAAVNASGLDGDDPDDWEAWYDELFVVERTVVLIDYDHPTHISLFDLGSDGGLRHRDSYQIRSHDFFAASRGSARLVGDRLLLSTSVLLTDPLTGGVDDWQPAIARRGSSGLFSPMRAIRDTRVMEPVETVDHNTQAQSVISCSIAPEFRCSATVVLAAWLSAYYVSPTAAYVWSSPWPRDRAGRSLLYRLPLDGGPVTAIGINGVPASQFSFLEDEQQILNVTVDNHAGAWLLRVPLSAFADGSEDVPQSEYRPIEAGEDLGATTRFVGPYAVAIVRHRSGSTTTSSVVAVHLQDGRRIPLEVPHDAHRIDAVDDQATIVGPGADGGVHVTRIDFSSLPVVGATLDLPRLPGFEQYAGPPLVSTDVNGLASVAVPLFAGTSGRWHELPPRVAFVDARHHSLALAGSIDAEMAPDQSIDVMQPLSIDGRVFALIGGELIEARPTATGVEVVHRARLDHSR